MRTGQAVPPARNGAPAATHRALHFLGLLVFVLCVLVWVGVIVYAPGALNRDWVAFDRAATRAAHGHFGGAYTASAGERWPFLYPPFVLYLVLPLASLGYRASYVAVLVAGLVAVVAALALIRRTSAVPAVVYDGFVGLALGCGVVLVALIPGQLTPLLLLAIAGAVALHQAGREGWSGAAFGALVIKPPIAAPFFVYLVVRRQWRALRGAATVAAIAIASTIPMGPGVWSDFARRAGTIVTRERKHLVPVSKQISLLGALRTVVPSGATAVIAVAWLSITLATGSLVARAIWRSRHRPMTFRGVGVVILATLALSPRVYFYELLLCVIPLAGLYLEGATYRSPTARRLAGLSAAGAIIATDTVLGPGSGAWLSGFFLTAWLALEARDLAAGPVPPPESSDLGMRHTTDGVIFR